MNSDSQKTNRKPIDVVDSRDTVLNRWLLYIFIIAASYVTVSFAFHLMLGESMTNTRLNIHNMVIDGTAPKPVQYRILTYYTVEGLHHLTGISIWRLDLIIRFVFTALSGVFLFKYLRRWFDFSTSALGSMILFALLPVTYVDYIHQPHDIPNLFFTILALSFIRDKREAWLLLLIPIAMLNRESFIFVLWAWFFYNYDRLPIKLLITEFSLFGLIAIVIYFALPYYYGARENYVDMLQVKNNLTPLLLIKWVKRLLAFMVPFLIAGFIRFKSKPLFLRRAMGFVAVYMLVNFLVGMYQETRLFLPILPVIIPLGLATLFVAHDPDTVDVNDAIETK